MYSTSMELGYSRLAAVSRRNNNITVITYYRVTHICRVERPIARYSLTLYKYIYGVAVGRT